MKAFRYKEMKIGLHDAGHMTKMAVMPIYGKNPSKSSSPEPAGRFSRTIEACDLKVGRYRQLIEIMKVCEY